MPKDYQEIERIVELLKEQYIEKFKKNWGFPLTDEQAEEMDWWVGNIKTTLTTYGNARELEGVEKVEKIVHDELYEIDFYTDGSNPGADEAWKRIIAKIKSELK